MYWRDDEEYQETYTTPGENVEEDILPAWHVSWILMDFRSPRRPFNGIQDFHNRKGLDF